MKYIIIGFITFFLHSNALSQTYSPLGSGFNFETRTLYYDSTSSTLYAGGGFWQTGTGEPMWRISQWNGTNWDSIGHGLDGLVLSITKYKGEIYAGGWFVSSFDSVGTKFPGLAKWNGTNWVKIENDTTPQCCVLELYTYDNDLYVGGTFDSINGQLATGIARYDGTNWYYYPPIPNVSSYLYVSAIVIFNSELCVAGNFNGGPGLCDIVKFDGFNWVSVGGGLSGSMSDVADMKIYQNKLYIVGNLSAAAGDHGNGIAIWDGTTWSQAGSGLLPSTVKTLEEFQGNLYVGGQIQSAGGIPVNNIAKWDGNAWHNIGVGFDNGVTCLESKDSNNLYIGGAFITANGDTVNRICEYNLLTGIGEISNSPEFQISPNPAAEKITLTCIIPSHLTEVKLLITDLTGRVISSNQIQGNPRELEVDISYLNNGSYMVNLEHNGNILASRKLMVVK
ncbi:MAG: T9SS type A sorting domain-containing protein [Bacteroidetes bacterium]|nr:T9SS type A sorting domain-containing protein [Bacteroidota bacterium]